MGMEDKILELVKQLEEEKRLADKRTEQLYTLIAAISTSWGDIIGTLADQIDLQDALDAKALSSHTHAGGDITSQVSDSDQLDGHEATYFAEKTQESWTAPSFLNSWVNFGGVNEPAGYFKDSFEVVHLRGMIKDGTIGQPAFILPEGYRPAYEAFYGTASNDLFGQCVIQMSTGNEGKVIPHVGDNTWFSLAGITFRAE